MSVTFSSLFWQIWGCLPEGKIEVVGKSQREFMRILSFEHHILLRWMQGTFLGFHLEITSIIHFFVLTASVCCLPKVSAHTPPDIQNNVFSFSSFFFISYICECHVFPPLLIIHFVNKLQSYLQENGICSRLVKNDPIVEKKLHKAAVLKAKKGCSFPISPTVRYCNLGPN